MLPTDWRVAKLGDIGEFKNGINKSKEDFGSGSRFVNLMDVFGRTEIRGADFELVNASPNEIEAYELRTGDVLFVRSSVKPEGVGLTAVVTDVPEGTLYGGFLIRFRQDGSIDLGYSKHCFYEGGFRHRLRVKSTISANTNVNQHALKSLKLALPPLSEQRRIAEVLNTWDQAIALTERRIEAARQRKKGLMQRLLTGRMRFPGFEGEEWCTVKLGQIFNERKERGHEDLPLLSVTAEEGIIYRDELDRRDTSSSDKSKYLRVCEGDITYNTMRMWQGRSGVSEYEGIVSPAYTVCDPKPAIDVDFIGYLFQLPSVIYKFRRYSQGMGSDTWTLRFDSFAAITVQIPNFDEQKRIAVVLQTCDREIELLTQKRDALQRQKKGLMQRLLTGRVRVRV